jgi:hypothetical protein
MNFATASEFSYVATPPVVVPLWYTHALSTSCRLQQQQQQQQQQAL